MDDPAAQAFRRHYRQIYGFVRRRAPSGVDAEDIAAEVFADAAASLHRFESVGPPVLAWLYTVARRRPVDASRRRGLAGAYAVGMEDGGDPPPPAGSIAITRDWGGLRGWAGELRSNGLYVSISAPTSPELVDAARGLRLFDG